MFFKLYPIIASSANVHVNYAHTEHESIMHTFELIFHSNLINFLLVIALLVWMVRKYNLGSIIGNEQDAIKNALSHSEKIKEEAITKEKDVLQKVDNLKKEVLSIHEKASDNADHLSLNILEQAETVTSDLLKNHEKLMDAEKNKVNNIVSAEVTDKAFLIAESYLKENLTSSMHKEHIEKFIDSLDEIEQVN